MFFKREITLVIVIHSFASLFVYDEYKYFLHATGRISDEKKFVNCQRCASLSFNDCTIEVWEYVCALIGMKMCI